MSPIRDTDQAAPRGAASSRSAVTRGERCEARSDYRRGVRRLSGWGLGGRKQLDAELARLPVTGRTDKV